MAQTVVRVLPLLGSQRTGCGGRFCGVDWWPDSRSTEVESRNVVTTTPGPARTDVARAQPGRLLPACQPLYPLQKTGLTRRQSAPTS